MEIKDKLIALGFLEKLIFAFAVDKIVKNVIMGALEFIWFQSSSV